MFYNKFIIALCALFFISFMASVSSAQDFEPESEDNTPAVSNVPQNAQLRLEQFPSLFLTPNEQSLIREARAGFNTSDPTKVDDPMGGILQGSRELILGGVAYSSRADWTIWLNGQKITPKNLPPEILDIAVYKDHIRLKWIDSSTNQIFPVKLRSNQRFNMDTRMFLPGAGT